MRTKNIVAVIVPSIVLGACATGGARADRVPQTPALPTGQGELTVVNPRLPDADRQMVEIRDDSGDVASALVDFCVAPDGHVDHVTLLRRSGSRAYDMALIRDVPDWKFSGEAQNPSRPETCEVATVVYRIPL